MMSQAFKRRLDPILPQIVEHYGTPFHIYDEVGIREGAERLNEHFSGLGFREFFAVKALPNPAILKIMAEAGFGFDCSSIPELMLARAAGATGEDIMFTSNNTSTEEFHVALANGGCILNLDDVTLIDKVPGKYPELACFRYNPGMRRSGNEIIGKPEEAKYGVPIEHLLDAYKKAWEKGSVRFGIHTMICSNELNYKYMVQTVAMLLDLIEYLGKNGRTQFEFINIGGGIGIPYRPEQQEFNLVGLARETRELFSSFWKKMGYVPKLFMENGRFITGPHGVLVTTVINQKHTFREYRGVDACMSSLMRPGMYGAYHHIDVLTPEGVEKGSRMDDQVVDVVGSLCENNDKFAVNRRLPRMNEGDLVRVHDTGAHGIAMGFQYNGRLRPKELLLCSDRSVKLIGRAETAEDLFVRYSYTPNVLRF